MDVGKEIPKRFCLSHQVLRRFPLPFTLFSKPFLSLTSSSDGLFNDLVCFYFVGPLLFCFVLSPTWTCLFVCPRACPQEIRNRLIVRGSFFKRGKKSVYVPLLNVCLLPPNGFCLSVICLFSSTRNTNGFLYGCRRTLFPAACLSE